MRIDQLTHSTPISIVLALLFICQAQLATAQVNVRINIEEPPINYFRTADDNRVSRLMEKLKSKELTLTYSTEQGYLQSILAALDISVSSQTLVLSKTSLQVQHISPRNPRAIYFNDDTYVGWVRGSTLMEISTADPRLGTAFYTVDMPSWRPKFVRAGYDCLGCHVSSMTQGIPGHAMRSVEVDFDGTISLNGKALITDDVSHFSDRWGGWYVTGTHGEMRHRGNRVHRANTLNFPDNGNRENLLDSFDTQDYLSSQSDIVALMVLGHQTNMHNSFARSDFIARKLQYDHALLANDERSASEKEYREQLRQIAQDLVDQMLFCQEFQLTHEVQGTKDYVDYFSSLGPFDSQGRSLRQFDLKTRLFKYPCSYLIYSPTFDALSDDLRALVMEHLRDVLAGKVTAPKYGHLTPELRRDLLEILCDTKPSFAATQTNKIINAESQTR